MPTSGSATIDGADFERANVFGAELDRLAPEEARNLVVVEKLSGNSFGPRVRELAKLARSLPELRTWAKLDLPDGATVRLSSSPGAMDPTAIGSTPATRTCRASHLEATSSNRRGSSWGWCSWQTSGSRASFAPDGIEVEAQAPRSGGGVARVGDGRPARGLGPPALSSEEFRRQQKAQEADPGGTA